MQFKTLPLPSEKMTENIQKSLTPDVKKSLYE